MPYPSASKTQVDAEWQALIAGGLRYFKTTQASQQAYSLTSLTGKGLL